MNNTKKLRNTVHGILAICLLVASTIVCFIPILFLGLLKLLPNRRWKIACINKVDAITVLWNDINNGYLRHAHPVKWDITGLDNLHAKSWYLVIANHQSWLDIVILQRLFNRRIPVLKFFLKDQLKWVPLLGFAWWAMGFPFMQRYSKDYLAKNPHKKGKDLQTTSKAAELFKVTPTAVMNFVEGTRFALDKKQQQQSPYQHLLKPRAGGLSFVISTMGQQLSGLLDVTIVYSVKEPTLWDFLCRKIKAVKVHVRQIPIPPQFTNPQLITNEKTQTEFRDWLNNHWLEKDSLITRFKEEYQVSL